MIDQSFERSDDQTDKFCEAFILNIRSTEHYSTVSQYMRDFKTNQKKDNALKIFIQLHDYIKSTGSKPLEDEFKKCLVSEAFIKEENKQKPRSTQHLHNDVTNFEPVAPPVPVVPKHIQLPQHHHYEEMNEELFMRKIHGAPYFNMLAKVVELYLKCIITLGQLQQFAIRLFPNRSLCKYFIDVATQIEAPRRKGSFFVSLNQLSESELKNRIGASYVEMPNGYANHCNDHTLPPDVRKTLNRQWVSMPLGTQFKNMKKNQYEEEMFKLEEERFEVDITIMNFRKCIEHLKNISQSGEFKPSSILERTLFRVYGTIEVYDLLKRTPEQSAGLIIPRMQEKLKEITGCKKKSIRIWEQGALKNFQKSLDHRSYYFQNYEKKYNLSVSRWDKETQFRHQLYINPNTPNPESYNTNINTTVDTFENVTRQKCIQSKVVNLSFPPTTGSFMKFPQNKILYVYDFEDTDTLYDIIGIIYSKVHKKNTLQYLLLKLMKLDTRKAMESFEDKCKKFQKFKETTEGKNNDSFDEDDLVTTKKDRKKTPDIEEQFLELIDEDTPYISYKQTNSPFQGPAGHVFIGSKSHYHFIRYLLVIYQRFIKAREIIKVMEAEDASGFLPGERYDKLKSILMNKSKEPNFDDTFRKIFEKNAFLFFTLSKLVEKASRIINNPDDLSSSIIHYDTKYYNAGIQKLEKFQPKPEIEQIMRVYHQQGVFYRFCWVGPLLYISSWNSIYKEWHNRSQYIPKLNKQFNALTSNPDKKTKVEKEKEKSQQLGRKRDIQELYSEYITAPNDMLLLQKGQQFYCNTNKKYPLKNTFPQQLKRVKKAKQLLNI